MERGTGNGERGTGNGERGTGTRGGRCRRGSVRWGARMELYTQSFSNCAGKGDLNCCWVTGLVN